MDVILRSSLSQEHQEIFNRVRLNLRLLTASDLVIADRGTQFIPDILKGHNPRKSTLNWPQVMKLPPSWIDTFRNILINVIQPQLQPTPLGRWTEPGHQKFLTYADITNTDIVSHDTFLSLPSPIKTNYAPVDICATKNCVLGKLHLTSKDEVTEAPSLSSLIQSSPKWKRNLWRGANFSHDTLLQVTEILQQNNLCIAGDGSVRDQFGSFAWCLSKKDSVTPFFTTTGPVDGHHHHMRALRAEATHVLASISLITALEQFLNNNNK